MTRKGIWDLQEARDKQLQSEWSYSATDPGSYFTWGNNNKGQLGQNSTQDISSPVQVPGSWNSVFASGSGEGTSGGVKTDGTMWTWGFNGSGQGGRNDRVHRSSPVQLGTDTNWATGVLRTGNYWTMALKTNGTLWTWGRNGEGQLGQNSGTVFLSSPTQIGTDTDWNYAQDKYDQDAKTGMVIKTNGTLWGWGTQDTGALGLNGPNASRSSPVQVGTNTNWNVVSISNNSVFSIKTDGTLWAWGVNERGELGQNQGPGGPYGQSRSSPTQVGTDTTWSQIRAAGGGSVWALKTNGTMWSWGYNSFGMLGHNNKTTYSSPTQVGTETTWESVRGCSRALAKMTKTDGTFWIWGRNDFGGAVPGGESVDFSSPVQVPGTSFSPLVGGTNYGAAVISE
jgi:alpha-tubulin suppressor-like RCC1 family protein